MMSFKDTAKVLTKLRKLMRDKSLFNGKQLEAYIIPSSDSHGSEYLCEKDKRRQFISGFSGSSGTAVVTHTQALLWTDGRYFLQAEKELDSNWQLMKDGLAETLSIGDWLANNLPKSSFVGIDATLYEEDLYHTLASKLKANNCDLYHTDNNLVDVVWKDYNKPTVKMEKLIKLDVANTGKSTKMKLEQIRSYMTGLNLEYLVVTSLDEIAWLLNMRSKDIPFGTVFFSYCIISSKAVRLFTDLDRLNQNYIEGSSFRSYLLNEDPNFEFYEYEEFFPYFEKLVSSDLIEKNRNVEKKKKIFLSSNSSHAIHSYVPSELIYKDLSYLSKLKQIKNANEIEAAKRIHTRDSTLLVEFFYLIQNHFKKNTLQEHFKDLKLNEYNLAEYLDNMRYQTSGCLSPSFETICSIGSNGAIIHYKPELNSSKNIENNNILLLDSGGHYLDMGTTDVTRTVFLGDYSNITPYQKECFTRVLKGHIQLALRIFPSGTKSELLDSFARQALWQAGLDYRHGTGHGVGALLNVHELPIITNRKSQEIGVQESMIVTNEPGYYEDGQFGIRIENCMLVVKAETTYRYSKAIEFLKFEPLTLVPIQREFIDKSLLSVDELAWLNDYHQRCADVIGNELKASNKLNVYDWLLDQAKPL